MINSDNESLHLLYNLTGGFPYNPPSYTCIKEFSDNFPKAEPPEFNADPRPTQSAWMHEAPYPRIYTKDYKKTLLTILK